jgi:hypothetical protein
MSTGPLVFIETEDKPPVQKPKLKRQNAFLKDMCRPLWQTDNVNDKTILDDLVYKYRRDIPKVTFNFDSQVCGRNGICCECQLSREIEEHHQSETDNSTQQPVSQYSKSGGN